MKTVSPKAQELLYNINEDIPTEIKLGKRVYKVRDLKQSVANRISLLIVKKNAYFNTDNSEEALEYLGNMSSKAVSMAILGSVIKVKLFHWFFWRYIYHTCTEKEINAALMAVIDRLNLGFFLQNIICLETMNQMKMTLTKKEALSYQAELFSDKKPTF